MADDIKSTSDGTTGDQNLGTITVKTGGKGTNGRQLYEDDRVTIDISTINDKYDEKFDDYAYMGAGTGYPEV